MKRVKLAPFPPNPVSDTRTLGLAIRACRTEQGLTIEEAALTIGIAKQTLSDIEAGKPTVGTGILLKAAAELGVVLFVARSRERDRVLHLLKKETR